MAMPRRPPNSYARRSPTREPYDYVLIVCEGSKTEPNYLKELRIKRQLGNANIEICRPPGNDPMSIVEFAEKRIKKDDFTRGYCVFDRDGHTNYDQALRMISELTNGQSGKLRAITSVPCFEIWPLLHFRYSSAPFEPIGRQSACDRVMAELKKYFPDYVKGLPSLFNKLEDRLNNALKHAKMLTEHNNSTGSKNPSTGMHELVQYLCNLKK